MRILSLFTAAALLLALFAGCGAKTSDTAHGETEASPTEAPLEETPAAPAGTEDTKEETAEIVRTVPAFKTAWANYTDDRRLTADCLNSQVISQTELLSSELHLPVFRLGSRAEIESFVSGFSDILSFDYGYNEVPSFSEAVSEYGEDFFAENSLLCVYMTAGSGSFRYGVRDVTTEGSALCVNVERTNNPEVGTDDMAGWFIIVELNDPDVQGVSEFDALYVGDKK